MKKTLSFLLSFVMLLSITAGIDLSAYAYDNYNGIIYDYISYSGVDAVCIIGYESNNSGVEIPEKINGYRVQKIDNNAFANNDVITTVTIPLTVQNIGDKAFENCSKLESIMILNPRCEISYSEYDWDNDIYTYYNINDFVTIYGYNYSIAHDFAAECGYEFSSLGDFECKHSAYINEYGECINCQEIVADFQDAKIGTNIFNIIDDNTWGYFQYTSDHDYSASIKNTSDDNIVLKIKENNDLNWDYETLYPNQNTDVFFYEGNNYLLSVCFEDVSKTGKVSFLIEEGSPWKFIQYNNSYIKITGYYGPSVNTLTIPEEINGYPVTQVVLNHCSCQYDINKLVISKNVEQIEYCGELYNLKSISVDKNNNYYTSKDDVLYSKDFKKCIWYPKDKDSSSYTMPDSVINISDECFEDSEYLKSITLSKNLKRIGNDAFRYSNIESIVVPDSVLYIGQNAFSECANLSSVILGNKVKEIGYDAFNYCNLERVDIPESVEKIGKGVFDSNNRLKEINVSSLNKNYSSDNGVLFNKNKSVLITYPGGILNNNYSVPDTVTSIGSIKNDSLRELIIPIGISYLSDYMVPTNDITIEIKNPACDLYFEYIDDNNSFIIRGYENSTAQKLASEIGCAFKSLGAFLCENHNYNNGECIYCHIKDPDYNINATAIEVGEHKKVNVTKYYQDATYFYFIPEKSGKYLLFTNTDYPTSDSVYDCECNEEIVNVDNLLGNWQSVVNRYVCTLEKGKKYLISTQFYKPLHLGSYTISILPYEEYEGMGYMVNTDSTATLVKCNGITEKWTIPAKINNRIVSGIDNYLWYDNYEDEKVDGNLTQLTIPETVTDIDMGFLNHYQQGLKSVKVLGKNKAFTVSQEIVYNKSKTKLLLLPSKSTAGTVTIPETVNEIGEYAFYQNERLAKINFPKSLKRIGNNAFEGTSLSGKINIPETVTQIGNGVFTMTDITEVTIPESVQEMGVEVFSSCSLLENADIKAQLKAIPKYTFSSCEKLENVILPSSLSSIEEGAFSYSGIKNIELPLSLTNIDSEAFASSQLTSINVPENVNYIGDLSFFSDSLKVVVIQNPNCEISDSYDEQHVFSDSVKIHGYKNSTADFYSLKYNIDFIEFCESHSWDNGRTTINANCSVSGEKVYTCKVCKATKSEIIPKTDHTYKAYVTKATTSKNGSIVTKCTVCGSVKSKSTIYYPKTIKLSTTSYTYNGKTKTPSVTVKNSKGKTLKKNTDYTVTYAKGRKNVGKYSVKITFKGNYSGSKTLYFTIIPKATTISSVTAKSKGFTVKWKKQTSQTTGYQIQYSTSSKFKNAKTVTVSKNKTTSKTISKLKAKKKYYVRVRTYKTVNGNKIYSSWSKSKSVTTKK